MDIDPTNNAMVMGTPHGIEPARIEAVEALLQRFATSTKLPAIVRLEYSQWASFADDGSDRWIAHPLNTVVLPPCAHHIALDALSWLAATVLHVIERRGDDDAAAERTRLAAMLPLPPAERVAEFVAQHESTVGMRLGDALPPSQR